MSGIPTSIGVRYVQYYDFDGEPENYSDLSEETYVQDKKVYCIHCDKYIGMYAKLFPEQF